MKSICIITIALLHFNFLSSQTNQDKVLMFVENNPTFPGGNSALTKFIDDHLVYPEIQKKDNIQGKVLIRFIVDVDGSVISPEVIRSVNPTLDQEAIRVIKSLPKFTPGKQQGQTVKVYFNVPVEFKLPK